MVSVPYCEAEAVLPESRIFRQCSVKKIRVFSVYQPAREMASALHQFKIIEHFASSDRVKDPIAGIAAQKQNMGALQACPRANLHTRRDAGILFAGAAHHDGRGGA